MIRTVAVLVAVLVAAVVVGCSESGQVEVVDRPEQRDSSQPIVKMVPVVRVAADPATGAATPTGATPAGRGPEALAAPSAVLPGIAPAAVPPAVARTLADGLRTQAEIIAELTRRG